MRYAEKTKIFGSVLIGVYYTHLGIENEKLSGYFDSDWQWDAIKNNQHWIIEFASTDDPWIPIEEPRMIHQKLDNRMNSQIKGTLAATIISPHFRNVLLALKRKINYKNLL
ncbi:MAG: hypothetical protein KGZ39_03465 [Simkania sp.]|nr:hypothetical protein [Simkania sp.]